MARSRPLSVVSIETSEVESTPSTNVARSSLNEEHLSRNQIAESLELNDPAWFRQTEDRGFGSAAYRRNKDDNVLETTPSNARVRLLGLSRDSSLEPEKQSSPTPESVHSESFSLGVTMRGKFNVMDRYSSFASSSLPAGALSPLPTLSSQTFQQPSDTSSSVGEEPSAVLRTLAMSPSQGRISPDRLERPHSPTKGLGGFVQSAMLKRSDSVNKRWSAQAGPRLSRGNSVASNRNGYEGSRQAVGEMSASKDSRPPSPSRDTSPFTTSRPGSSLGAVAVTVPDTRIESDVLDTGNSYPCGDSNPGASWEFAKPTLPSLKASPSFVESLEFNDGDGRPTSPSKKWSPTKASWLENALNKPESPKPRILPPQQPSWMMDISKAKQQRGSLDLGRSGVLKDITAGGSIRSPPPGIANRPRSFRGLPKRSKSVIAAKPRDMNEIAPIRNAEITTSTKPRDQVSDEDTETKNHKVENTTMRPHFTSFPTSAKKSETREEPISESRSPSLKHNSPAPSTVIAEGLQARSRLASTSTTKPKPQTPPKKDFRLGLKPRRVSNGKESKEEAEFKNVFGKLKRTHTQNYIAPDEFKNNILRGKAGLAMTGGPLKTERRDELKESILKQRETMKGGALPGIPKKPRGISALEDRVSPPPEAIARRLGLTKPESMLSSAGARSLEEGGKPPAKPEGLAELMSMGNKPRLGLPEKQRTTSAGSQRNLPANGKLGDRFTSSLAGLLSRGPSPIASAGNSDVLTNPSIFIGQTSMEAQNDAEMISGQYLTHLTKSRARGPKRRLPQTKEPDTTDFTQDQGLSTFTLEAEPGVSEVVTQRPSTAKTPSSAPLSTSKSDIGPVAKISDNNRKSSQSLLLRAPSADASLLERPKPNSPKAGSSVKESTLAQITTPIAATQKPIVNLNFEHSSKQLNLSNAPPANINYRSLYAGELATNASNKTVEKNELQQPQTKAPTSSIEKENYENPSSQERVMGTTAVSGKSPAQDPSLAAQIRPSIRLPGRKNEESALENGSPNPTRETEKPIGLGIQTAFIGSIVKARLDRNLPSPPIGSPNGPSLPKSPPLPGKKPPSIASDVPSSTRQISKKYDHSQIAQTPGPSSPLVGFLRQASSPNPKINVDTQSVLASRSENDGSDKIKTLRKQMYVVTGGGRLLPVPSHQEHILFEENLYLCTHIFGTLVGTRMAEVYLWVGDGVAQSAAEDAQLFARKVAKENNGKLITLNQGKETSTFFQALGGIVITRRGSGSRGDSPSRTSATYMLCGRRHGGQIAFDEVDFNARSLCSGFPYIISARFGKLYLWKGSGSGADELGCARLIGMDLGLTGEIEEVDEGCEPDAFWESVPGGRSQKIPAPEAGMSHHWHLKPSCHKYATRLFSVDVEPTRPKPNPSNFMWGRRGSTPQEETMSLNAHIREIIPFTQKDISQEGLFVFDAFFEIFLYVSIP